MHANFKALLVLIIIWTPAILSSSSSHPRDRHLPRNNNNEIEDIETRLLSVEQRLRSIEEPMWEIGTNGKAAWDRCTEGSCYCEPSTGRLSCWRNKLKSLPPRQFIPSDIVAIDLSSNFLTTLHRDTFRGLAHMKELDLSSNAIDFIPPDLFTDLHSLVTLHMARNRIRDLDSALLYKVSHLSHIDFNHNKLRHLPDTIFHSNRRITIINLSNNELTEIHDSLFLESRALEELHISNNRLVSLPGGCFSVLDHLKALQITGNRIANISDSTFGALVRLEYLQLGNNDIEVITAKTFANLTNLISLDLTMNRISQISKDAFKNLFKLEELLLGQNAIHVVSNGLLSQLHNLKKLMLFSNNIKSLQKNAFFGLQSLKVLFLNNNLLMDFPEDIFQPLAPQLEKIRLDSNKLKFLPNGCLDNLAHLVAVKLEKNPWHCDCRALYLARWLRVAGSHVTDGANPTCRGPLGGYPVGLLRFDHLCEGEFLAMVKLSPRLPLRDHVLLQKPEGSENLSGEQDEEDAKDLRPLL